MSIIYHEELMEHDHWPQHPESPFRLRSIKKKLELEGLWNDVRIPSPVDEEDLLRVHGAAHVERIRKGGNMPIDTDTMLKDHTFDLAKLSAGTASEAVDIAAKGGWALALTRPPGHHARSDEAGGFCYFNNAAVAVAKSGLRTAIVDLDAHHGNGTEEIFYYRDDVLFISVHQEDSYPGTGHTQDMGAGEGLGFNVNIPLVWGSGNDTYSVVFDEIIIPILREFKPELLVISLGTDAHYCDTLSNMSLNTSGYAMMCGKLIDLMEGCNIAFILEGGYHLRSTAEVVASVIAHFEGTKIKPEYDESRPEPEGSAARVSQVKADHSSHWHI